MANRKQRRAASRHKGKRPGETYADVLAKQKMIKEAVDKSVHDTSVTIEAEIKTQRAHVDVYCGAEQGLRLRR